MAEQWWFPFVFLPVLMAAAVIGHYVGVWIGRHLQGETDRGPEETP